MPLFHNLGTGWNIGDIDGDLDIDVARSTPETVALHHDGGHIAVARGDYNSLLSLPAGRAIEVAAVPVPPPEPIELPAWLALDTRQ